MEGKEGKEEWKEEILFLPSFPPSLPSLSSILPSRCWFADSRSLPSHMGGADLTEYTSNG